MPSSTTGVSAVVRVVVFCGFVIVPNCATVSTAAAASAVGQWQYTPYHVRVLLAVEAPGQLRQLLEEQIPRHIVQRVETAIGPIWKMDIEVASSPLRHRMFSGLSEVTTDDLATEVAAADKLMLLTIRTSGNGFRLGVTEYDTYVQHWSRPHFDACQQSVAVPERAFGLIWRAFCPLAQLELDPQDDQLASLQLRGSEIAMKDPHADWVKRGDVFLPVLRRTTREGELIEGGVQAVPWTYVTAEEIDSQRIVARVQSGTNRPLGVRRRGRVEQVAIAVRNDPAPTTLHLHSRTNPEKPLVGYEVYVQDAAAQSVRTAGYTDDTGRLRVSPGDAPVQLLLVKNGGQLLARVPVVPGAVAELDVPLPDDDPRLQAETILNGLQENLIDVVARRNILTSRIRRQIQDGQFDVARRLLDELDQLPGRAQFDRELTKQANLHRSPDAQIQRRIENLFANTRAVLGNYLDARALTELRDELNAAERAPTESGSTRQTASSQR